MRHTESRLQVSCVRWFRLQYPKYANNLFAIPNGGKRNSIEASIMKYEGVTAGVPDLFLAVQVNGMPGLFIEMKILTGKLTDAQRNMQQILSMTGYRVATCRSLQEFMDVVTNYMADV